MTNAEKIKEIIQDVYNDNCLNDTGLCSCCCENFVNKIGEILDIRDERGTK